MRCFAILLLGAVLAAAAGPAMAQSGPKGVFIDLVADGSIRAQLFTCIRRAIAQGGDVSFVTQDDPARTHVVGVRAMPTYAGRSLTGYVASINIASSMPAALRERLTQQLQGDEKMRTLADLRRYGATDLALLMVRPRGLQKFCDDVAAEIETALFDLSGRGGAPAGPAGR